MAAAKASTEVEISLNVPEDSNMEINDVKDFMEHPQPRNDMKVAEWKKGVFMETFQGNRLGNLKENF